MTWRMCFVAALLSGCAVAEDPPLIVPARLQVCPDSTKAPNPPPPPRTIGQIIGWSTGVMVARDMTADALAECKRRLAERNALQPQAIPTHAK